MNRTDPIHVLMTGATSGIGLEAVRRLSEQGHQLTLLCRDASKADQQLGWLNNRSTVRIVDLADLKAVNTICNQFISEEQMFDVIVLNAGLQYAGHREPRFSPQGIELTIAVNHLAHQLIAEKLMHRIGRVVITASEVHNPASKGGRVGQPAGLGNLDGLRAGAGAPMVDGTTAFNADKAYKDSKLCNLLMGFELSRRRKDCPVVAWSPGLVIPRSSDGFFRESRRANPFGQMLFGFIARDLLRFTESVERAGELLASLALENSETAGFRYLSNSLLKPGQHRFGPGDLSQEASDTGRAHELWTLSSTLIEQSLTNPSPRASLAGETEKEC